MKRKLLFVLPLLSCFLYFGCRKNETLSISKNYSDPFVAPAIEYLKTKISEDDFEKLDLNSINFLKNKEVTEGIMISSKDKSNQKSIILGKKENNYIGNWVNLKNINTVKDGIIKTESFDGNLINEVTFKDGKALKIIRTDKGETKTTIIKYPKKGSVISTNTTTTQIGTGVQLREAIPEDYHVLPDVTVTGYINTTQINYYSLYWAYNQSLNYTYSYSTTSPNGGGGGSTVTIDYESNNGSTVNINKIFNCFSNVSSYGAIYTVKLCSDVPINSIPSSSANSFGSSPGHTFLTITKQNGAQSVTRSIGFYPTSESVFSVPGMITDDKNHEYNASITMTITAAQFSQLQQTAVGLSTNQYNVCDNNCSNYAIKIFNSVRTTPITVAPLTVYLPSSSSMPPASPTANTIQIANSPQMLFTSLQNMKNANGLEAANIKIDQSKNSHAPSDFGECN